MARGAVNPRFRPILRAGYVVSAGGYFDAIDQFDGSVAVPANELATLPEPERLAADWVLIRDTVRRLPYTSKTRRYLRAAGYPPRRCHETTVTDELTPPTRGLVVLPGTSPVELGLRRFAVTFTPLPELHTPTLAVAPRGRSTVPWGAVLAAPIPFECAERSNSTPPPPPTSRDGSFRRRS